MAGKQGNEVVLRATHPRGTFWDFIFQRQNLPGGKHIDSLTDAEQNTLVLRTLEQMEFWDLKSNSVYPNLLTLLSKKKTSLKTLSFTNGEISEKFLEDLAEALKGNGLTNFILKDVRLKRQNKRVTPRGLTRLIGHGRSLTSVTLSGLALEKEDAAKILLTIRDNLLAVRKLDISKNTLNGFFKEYENCYTSRDKRDRRTFELPLHVLIMRNSRVLADDLELMVADKHKLLPYLKKLDISENQEWTAGRCDFDSNITLIEEQMIKSV